MKPEKKTGLTIMVEKEEAPVPATFKEEDEEVRQVIYMVAETTDSSVYSAAIFKLEIEIGQEVKAKDRFVVFNRKECMGLESSPTLGSVSCDMVYNDLYLVCTYSNLDCDGGQIRQAPVHIFDTVNERLFELPNSDRVVTPKPMPIVMAVGTGLYVYGQSVGMSLNVPLPTLESFSCGDLEWESQLPPQFDLPDCTSVEGYAVINNFLLISVVDFNGRISRNEFFYLNFSGGSNSNSKWEKLIFSKDQKDIYYPFSGKAEFVDGVIYSCRGGLSVYRVDSCSDEEGLHISPAQLVGFPKFATPPLDWSDSYFSFCFAYMGIGKRFCIIKTGDSGCIDDQQYTAISVVEVSDDLKCLTTLTSTICPLNIGGLYSDLVLNSCFVKKEGHSCLRRASSSQYDDKTLKSMREFPNISMERKKMRLTKMRLTKEKPPMPIMFKNPREARGVIYMVCQLKSSSVYSAAIFKLVMDMDEVDAQRRFEVFDRRKYLGYESCPRLGSVSCGMVYNELWLVCSYSQLDLQGSQIRQAPVHVLDTMNEQVFELPTTDRVTPKPFPMVMAVRTKLHVYGQSAATSLNVPLPTLETFNIASVKWESQSPPQFDLPDCASVEGYAIVNNFLLISVADFNGRNSRNEFFYWKFSGSNLKNSKWEKMVLSKNQKNIYRPFSGKAEFIEGVIYSYNRGLYAYRVRSCSDENGLRISTPRLVGFPEFAAPPVDWSESIYFSFCFSYMGVGKRFCIIKTGDSGCTPDQQYVAICVVEVSNDLQCLTTLTSTICPLNISGLHSDLILTSCFVKMEGHVCFARVLQSHASSSPYDKVGNKEIEKKSQYNKTLKSTRAFPNISMERKKMRLTKMVEKEKPPMPIMFKNPQEARGVIYMVCQLNSSSLYSAAIFKLVMDMDEVNAERRFEVFNRRKYLGYESSPRLGSMSCGMVYNELWLVCSYSQLDVQGSQIHQAPVHLFDTMNEQVIELPTTDRVKPKPFPIVMAVGNKLHVYGQSAATSLIVPLPTLQTFNIASVKWESQSPPQFDLPDCTSVEGYAVVKNFLLISVADFNGRNSRNEFFYWKFSGSNLKNSKWEKMILSKNQKNIYHPFSGKAEFIEGVIYSYNRGLYAYRVRSCYDENGLRISPPWLVGFPKFAAPPVDWSDSIYFSFCFAYMGIGKRFCIIKTGDSGCTPDQQYVAICVVEVSNDLRCLSILTSTICPLNISGLHSDLILTSCFVKMEGHKCFARVLQSHSSSSPYDKVGNKEIEKEISVQYGPKKHERVSKYFDGEKEDEIDDDGGEGETTNADHV